MIVPVPDWIILLARQLKKDGAGLWVYGRPLAGSLLGESVTVWHLMTDGPMMPNVRQAVWTQGRPIRETLAGERLTIAAMAWNPLTGRLSDPFRGRVDMRRRVLRPVPGSPPQRDDSWCVHLIIRHGFRVDRLMSTGENAGGNTDQDRAFLNEALLSERPDRVFESLHGIGWIGRVLPELAECNITQGHLHRHSAMTHSFKAASVIKPDLTLRLAALLHDVGKGRTIQKGADRPRFPAHDRVGAEIARLRLAALGYEDGLIRRVENLVRWHMFDGNPHATVEALQRFVGRVGPGQVMELLELRRADILSAEGMPPSVRTVEALRVFARRVGSIIQEAGDS